MSERAIKGGTKDAGLAPRPARSTMVNRLRLTSQAAAVTYGWLLAGIVLCGQPVRAQTGPGAAMALTDLERAHQIVGVRVTTPPRIDGMLDEAAWQLATPISGFTQSKPREGEPATEATEVRILYDSSAIYIGAKLYDREPDRVVATVLRRDEDQAENDAFAVTLDTYHDHRTAYCFETNALGAQFDSQIIGEGGTTMTSTGAKTANNADWDAVWSAGGRRTEEGWSVEMAIPLWSIRYEPDNLQAWGINFRRTVRRRAEESYWVPVPRQYGITRLSMSGVLLGLEGLGSHRNLQFKPFGVAGLSQVAVGTGSETGALRDAGLDVKWGIGSNLTADLTLNTDFSQVEADDQQINLTRFSLLFPEKRQFFLENAGLFDFGGSIAGPVDFLGSGRVIGFHSRRIGISEDNLEVPLLGGGRLTGKQGPWSVGLLSIQTRDSDVQRSTNYSVGRVMRNLGGRSSVGALVTNVETEGGHYNRAIGFDSRLQPMQTMTVDTWWMKTATPGLDGSSWAGHVLVDWSNPTWGMTGGVMQIGDAFNPEAGFVNRTNTRFHDFNFHWTPEPRTRWVKQWNPHGAISVDTDPKTGWLMTRNVHMEYAMTFLHGEGLSFGHNRNFERLEEPFEIAPGVIVMPGPYHFAEFDTRASSDMSRTLFGSARYVWGRQYDGTFGKVVVQAGARAGARASVRVNWTRNHMALSAGAFTTDLVRTRVAVDFSPRLSLVGLVQYNSQTKQLLSNVRLDFIHTPGADLFIVYNERQLVSASAGQQGLIDRALIVKLTHLLRF